MGKKDSSIKNESFVKKSNKEPSESSKKNLPEVNTRFKPLAGKKESEIKMSSSERLPQTGSVLEAGEAVKAGLEASERKEKVMISLFLVVSMVMIFFTMQPSSMV